MEEILGQRDACEDGLAAPATQRAGQSLVGQYQADYWTPCFIWQPALTLTPGEVTDIGALFALDGNDLGSGFRAQASQCGRAWHDLLHRQFKVFHALR